MKSLITSLIIAAGITSSAFAQQVQQQEEPASKYSFYRFHAIHGGSDGFVDPGEQQQKEHDGTQSAPQEVATYFQVQLTNPSTNGVVVYVCSVENGCSRLGAGTYQVADIRDAAPQSGVVSDAVNAILKACSSQNHGGSDGRVPVNNKATIENLNQFLLKLQASN